MFAGSHSCESVFHLVPVLIYPSTFCALACLREANFLSCHFVCLVGHSFFHRQELGGQKPQRKVAKNRVESDARFGRMGSQRREPSD